MTIETKLKNLILDRYGSVREFVIRIDMPYSTFDTILKRGIGTATVHNILKVCAALHISADALAEGKIIPINLVKRTETVDIKAEIEKVIEHIQSSQVICFGDKELKPHVINSIKSALELSLSIGQAVP